MIGSFDDDEGNKIVGSNPSQAEHKKAPDDIDNFKNIRAV